MLAALGPRFCENERKKLVEHSSYDRVDERGRSKLLESRHCSLRIPLKGRSQNRSHICHTRSRAVGIDRRHRPFNGIHGKQCRFSDDRLRAPSCRRYRRTFAQLISSLVPAQAGTQSSKHRSPACAGMSGWKQLYNASPFSSFGTSPVKPAASRMNIRLSAGMRSITPRPMSRASRSASE